MNESKDHFSLLPPELLGKILDHVQTPDPCLVNPISKRFLPFQQEVLYREVLLRSYQQVEKLCWTAENNPAVLKIYLKELFSTLDQVEKLAVTGSSRIALVILSPQVSISSLPNVSKLSLNSNFRGFDDPFNPTFYTPLLNYTKLEDFSLWVFRLSSGVKLSSKSPPVISPCLPSLFSLSLKGPLSTSQTSVKRLISSFGYTCELKLLDTSSTSRIFDLLEDLESPEDLHFLSLQRYPDHGPPPQGSLLDLVAGSSGLLCLEAFVVGGTCSSLSPDFYSAVQQLPLEMLIFESEADVNLVELEKLITGAKKHETLKTIWFENVEGEMGTKIEDMGGEPWTGPNGDGWGPYPDWQLPEWTESFSARGLKKFLKVAEKEGIEVNGSAIEAIEIDDDFTNELDFLQGYGDFLQEFRG
ncbi:uncharacterized protein JCM6883_005487 [Sporobolomyces salmoneus]|uniref:uncharacterized protein n=1 Tax=Sporobolomyces salmoneus TaxID=183962 RepID=UPI003181DE98